MKEPVTPDSEKKAGEQKATPEESKPDPLVISMPVDVRSAALTVIAAVAGIIALQQAQSVLIPIVLGLLLSLR